MATLEQIQTKLKKLQAQADAMMAKKAQAAVDKIRQLMLEHGLTTADIEAKAKVKRQSKGVHKGLGSGPKSVTITKSAGTPLYHHPETGATWSGRGRAPAWIAGVTDRTPFLIANGTGAVVAKERAQSSSKASAKKSVTATRKISGKGQPKGPQPALYRDPKTGATWSGRGRAPAWLGKNRNKFLINDATVEGAEAIDVSPVKRKVGRPPKAISNGVAVKTVARKRVVSKKAASVVKPVEATVVAEAPAAPVLKKTASKPSAGRKAAATKAAVVSEGVPATTPASSVDATA
jgi:DNA-binding protein H-NS